VRLTAAGGAAAIDGARATTLAASLAAWSTHPLSRALTAAAGATAPAADVATGAQPAWSAIEEQPGRGLSAVDDAGRVWRLGVASWVDPVGADEATAQVWLGCEGRALAAFEFEEALRPGTAEALQALRDEGVAITVLTGDTAERAQALAARIGVADVRAGATPEAKLAAVTAAQAAGHRVAMVGDGINDAPVLARADVSLAMGQGALVSRSQADAVIASNRLDDLVRARRTARHAVRIVRQNFVWAGSYNALCIPLALVGWLPPWAAGLGMALSSLVVVFNALRAAR